MRLSKFDLNKTVVIMTNKYDTLINVNLYPRKNYQPLIKVFCVHIQPQIIAYV